MEWLKLTENERVAFAEEVWAMYESSYAAIGLIASGPAQLLSEYDVWWLCFDANGFPRAFRVAKTTAFGVKLGLSGTDGSKEAKRVLIVAIGAMVSEPGIYGEVSHRVEEIAMASGAPVVCVSDARRVLQKNVSPVDDLHYTRAIAGVGDVTKVMVGRPLGVEPTSFENPMCFKQPMRVREALSGFEDADELSARLADDDSLAPWLD